jgi:hypothetical protein
MCEQIRRPGKNHGIRERFNNHERITLCRKTGNGGWSLIVLPPPEQTLKVAAILKR